MLNEKYEEKDESIKSKEIKYFYDISDFPKFNILEENYEGILQEVLNVVKKENEIILETKNNDENKSVENENFIKENKDIPGKSKTFEPWVEKNLYQESNEWGWDVAPLMIGGVKIPERCKKFPYLFELVGKISGIVSVSYSLLKPGTHIVPHKGYDDYSEKMYRFHMGMIIPEGDIAIRVEKDIRKWENGKSFVFDDFMIHEAWNFTCKNRLVLIIDFLKDENILPDSIKFIDANFNKSIKGYINGDNDTDSNEYNKEFH